MSQATTLILLSQTPFGQGLNITGTKQPAASYYLGGADLQTVTWSFTSVTATVNIQASLAENPTSNDWFNVLEITGSELTQISYQNINGNFVWLRAAVSGFTAGVIQFIKVSY
jgi:hypothetical protein